MSVMIKVVKELKRRLDEQSEKLEIFNRIRKYKKSQTELNSTITEVKNSLKGVNSRLDDTEEQMIKPEDTAGEITQAETEKKKEWKP